MASTDLQKFCDELRAKISIVDVVSSKIKLVRKGREYMACCPFHNEKTPSFTVNEAKGFYHCFGCGAHGDIIKFEMEANGLSFIDAVEKLAHKVGMQLPKFNPESKEEAEKKATAYDIMEMAAKFFEKMLRLPAGREGLDYLYARGFDDEIIQKFRLGFAPGNNGLKAQLSSHGVSDKEMEELGLLTVPDNNRPHDFFRNRVMIPIMDKRGRVIAFGGRVLDKSQPKYLNSPETPVFNKRRILYNLNYARDKGFEAKRLIICEGYMDVIAMDKYGIGYAVAPLGTALTEEQIIEAWKVVNEPICCFDGDLAGIRAAVRSVDRVLPILKPGYSLQYAFLPDKLDPDEFLRAKGTDEFLKIVTDTMPLKDLLWRKNLEGRLVATPEQKAKVEKDIKEEVAKITDETVRNYYIQEMRSKIYAELRPQPKFGKEKDDNRAVKHEKRSLIKTVRTDLDDLVAKYVISAFVCYPGLVEEYEEKLLDFAVKDAKLKGFYEKILEIIHDNPDIEAEDELTARLDEILGQEAWRNMVDLRILKKQCPDIIKMRKELNERIIEVQLKQLEADIRDCKRILESGNFSDDDYLRFESLKKERDALINESDGF